MFCRTGRDSFVISKLLQWTGIRKVGTGYPRTSKLALPSPRKQGRRVENMKKSQTKFDFQLSDNKNVLWSFWDQPLPVAKLFRHRFRRQLWKLFQNWFIFTHLLRFQCTTLTDAITLFVSSSCITKTSVSICMCDILFERVLHSLIRGEYIMFKCSICHRHVRPTVIVVGIYLSIT